ncbi:3-oxoacid CoA-transferase, B subunit [compost metagenome]
MDLAIGAKRIFVMMEHLAKNGECKLIERCTYPLTGIGCVSRVYTDLATLEITAGSVQVIELVGDTTAEALQDVTPIPLDFSALAAQPARALSPSAEHTLGSFA